MARMGWRRHCRRGTQLAIKLAMAYEFILTNQLKYSPHRCHTGGARRQQVLSFFNSYVYVSYT